MPSKSLRRLPADQKPDREQPPPIVSTPPGRSIESRSLQIALRPAIRRAGAAVQMQTEHLVTRPATTRLVRPEISRAAVSWPLSLHPKPGRATIVSASRRAEAQRSRLDDPRLDRGLFPLP